MASQVTDYLATDDLTVVLGLIAATVFLLKNLYKPQPLTHPILLGRQSDVGRVRQSGESATYRNFTTGSMGRFPVRPGNDVLTIVDFVRSEFESARTLWSTRLTNSTLQDRVAAFGTGIFHLIGMPKQDSRVLLMLNDGVEFIISDLALASHSIQSYTLSSSRLFTHVFYYHPPTAIITHVEVLPQVLQVIYDAQDDSTNYTIIVVGELTKEVLSSVASNIKVISFTDVERQGLRTEKVVSPSPKPDDVFTVSFFEIDNGEVHGTQLTHANITAGVAAMRTLLPASHTFTSLDTIVSAHSLSTGYGRAIAYTAIYEGTSLATLNSTKSYHADECDVNIDLTDVMSHNNYPIPPPSILFLKPGHLESTVTSIAKEASKSYLLYPFARRHKLAGLREGYLTKNSLWDRLVFDGARAKVLGNGAGMMRGVIICGGPLESRILTPARIALSVPVMNILMHPLAAGPITASNPLDVQDFSMYEGFDSSAHVGPPCVNTELKLIGIDDEAVEGGADPSGLLLARGPSIGKLFRNDDYVSIPSEDEQQGWVATGVSARVRRNGTFQVS